MEKVQIFDTTLRDGEQTPGVHFDLATKIEIAQALENLGVDIIEAGFPASSQGDFEAVQSISRLVKKSTICGLARSHRSDIEKAAAALKDAERSRIHIFLATSDIHMEYKLKMSRAEVIAAIYDSVSFAVSLVDEIQFSAEDACRSDREFLVQAYEAAIEAGAKILNVPDTVGYRTPDEYGSIFLYLKEYVKGSDSVIWSAHCHDDLGLATANSIAAIQAGARQVECTINGLGERAGNAAMEEIVMAIATRKNHMRVMTGIQTKQIYRVSRLVSAASGLAVSPTKAIIGENAFAHESGIHQHGVLENPETYEIIKPESIGAGRSTLVLGKLSGRHAVEERLLSMGYQLSREKLDTVFKAFKELADKKAQIFDLDLAALVTDHRASLQPQWYRLQSVQIASSSEGLATGAVRIESSSGTLERAACGDGPVDAIFQAINEATQYCPELEDFQLRAVTSGPDALGEAAVRLGKNGVSVTGRGVSTDIVESSAKAYLDALNRLVSVEMNISEGGKK